MHDEQPPETLAFNVTEGWGHVIRNVRVEWRVVVVTTHDCNAPTTVPRPRVLLGGFNLHHTSRFLADSVALTCAGGLIRLAAPDA